MEEKRTNSDKFMLRLPDGMRAQIRVAAEENSRSMNAEIVARLRASFDSSDPEIRALARQMAQDMLKEVRAALKGVKADD